jgi:hypothetical protein
MVLEKLICLKAEPQKITFNVYRTNGDTERYAMINTGGDNWLFHNVTPTRITRPEIPSEKPHYKSIAPEVLDPTKPNEVWAPKVDGALNVFLLRPDKQIETYSYRPSSRGANRLIDHTFRLGLYRTIVPTAFKARYLREIDIQVKCFRRQIRQHVYYQIFGSHENSKSGHL